MPACRSRCSISAAGVGNPCSFSTTPISPTSAGIAGKRTSIPPFIGLLPSAINADTLFSPFDRNSNRHVSTGLAEPLRDARALPDSFASM
ncbi:hypothetical protein X947_3171 [Burkholderia pseudomallei MSHR7334]|nr:hypothetical protein X947_3171 [Burkholderia pseudomallei MSHR7334]